MISDGVVQRGRKKETNTTGAQLVTHRLRVKHRSWSCDLNRGNQERRVYVTISTIYVIDHPCDDLHGLHLRGLPGASVTRYW